MKKIILVLLLIISGCATKQNTSTTNKGEVIISESEQLLSKGMDFLSRNNTKKAIKQFDKVIESCEGQYNNKKQKFYAVRSPIETIYYMIKAASENNSAVAVAPTCAEALYLKGYSLLDLSKVESAEGYLLRAVDMSPVNSMYLSELAHIYQIKKDWNKSLEVYRKSEQNAETYSPQEVKLKELSRAKRGVGFVLIELGRLDEAEAKFRECLDINKNDIKALKEIRYIEEIRKKQ